MVPTSLPNATSSGRYGNDQLTGVTRIQNRSQMVCENQTHSSPSIKLELINKLTYCAPVLIEGSMIGEMIVSLPAAGTDIFFGNQKTPTDAATRIPNGF